MPPPLLRIPGWKKLLHGWLPSTFWSIWNKVWLFSLHKVLPNQLSFALAACLRRWSIQRLMGPWREKCIESEHLLMKIPWWNHSRDSSYFDKLDNSCTIQWKFAFFANQFEFPMSMQCIIAMPANFYYLLKLKMSNLHFFDLLEGHYKNF